MIKDFLELYEDDSFFASTSYSNEVENLYSNLITSAIGTIKSDSVDDEHLRYIQNIRKEVSKKTKKQSKIIISSCKESAVPEFKIALERYKLLHFIKFMIRIIDEDDKYNYNVDSCKKLFSDKRCLQLTEYLYNHQYTTWEDMASILSLTDGSLPTKYNELLLVKKDDTTSTISLTPKARNLYAFYLMKNIDIDSDDEAERENYNEGKVNEVLEYLIQYMLNSPKERKKVRKPKLHSSSANNNLERLLMLLDQKDNYSSCPIPKDNPEDKIIHWGKGNAECKKMF